MVGQIDQQGHGNHAAEHTVRRPAWHQQSSLIYEDEYILLAIISAIEVVVCFLYLQFGGHLFTTFIDTVIQQTGIYGLLTFKLLLVALVVFTCETLGYRKPTLGRKVVNVVNLLSVVTLSVVVYEFALLLMR